MSIYRDLMVPRLCQFTEIIWCPEYVNLQRSYGAPTLSIYRDYMMPRIYQFTEIIWCPEYVNLHRSIWRPDYANLHRLYGALPMSIYRGFMVNRLCQFRVFMVPQKCHIKRSCRDFMVPQEWQLTEIWQSFYGAPRMPIKRDLTEVLWCPKNVN